MISPGLGSIDKVPVHLIVGQNDTHCSPANAQRIASEIGSAVRTIDIIPGFTHGSFEVETDPDYVQKVLNALADDDSYFKEAVKDFLQ